jgi:hypothetical protein
MPNGFLVLNEKDWEKMTPEQREWATFNTLQSMNCRLNTLESKGFIDKTCSAIGGIVGGFLAFIGLKITG